MANLERLHTHDLELGATEAIQKHYSRHVVEARPVSQRKLDFEHARPRWLREMMAEATGVFFYVFPGIAAVTTFTLNKEDAGFGSLLQVGFAFAIGIAFAIITCASTSGGHFNPAITICFATWQGFPWKKVPYYIFAQIFGAFIAGLLLMGMYWEQLPVYAEATRAAGDGVVFNGGPASVLCAFPSANQSLGYLFLIEFFVDSYIGIVIWSALDPANPFISPQSAPFCIGLGKLLPYACMIWGFADVTISTNLARDLGTRIVAAIFYGGEAFSYNNYSWIAILVNIPATLFATGYYELLMRDSLQKIGRGHAVHEGGEEGLTLHLTKTRQDIERGATAAIEKNGTNGY
ncbi:hypothetical protein B0A54_05904 [Friedmanniomyces endolithicus]|uniref:Aquaporin-3 n=1 Tax=Friedmanniomyces endolithicus TaxID=329885 RepID=A0A4U0V532_9PEZI|nr:hypothetical protein LTS09_009836 [Friedmanniomyces endolithicus]TKA43422.1 hypothetical protein B0A54_05904 [Friedmanniomyces endolithicus]